MLSNQSVQREALMRNQDEQLRQVRKDQQLEYRGILNDQKATAARSPIKLQNPNSGAIH